jgi:diaminopimelate decarboxylase
MVENVIQVFQDKVTLSQTKRFLSNKEINIMAERYGTPLYFVDERTLHDKLLELHHAYIKFKGDVKIAYSVKANFNPSVIKTFMKDGITFDLTSLGELYFIKRLNGIPENVIYTSVTEELDEYVEVLKNGIKRIVVSSYYGFINLSKSADIVQIRPKTMVRINPEVGVKAEVSASYKNGKFGVPFNGGEPDSAYFIVTSIFKNPLLDFEGFHFHLGSQITDFICYNNALEKLNSLINKLKKEISNFSISTLDIGGGTPVFYNDPVPSPEAGVSIYMEKLNNLFADHGNFTLMIESGRFLVAESSIMASKIVNIKEYNDHKIIILDTGYHLLLDAALLKQEYPQEVIPYENKNDVYEMNVKNNKSSSNKKNIHLVGRLCDTLDVFPISKVSDLSYANVGNYILFYNIGAYSLVFNMPFHCQTKPPVIMKTIENDFKLIRKGTTYEELFIEEGGHIL